MTTSAFDPLPLPTRPAVRINGPGDLLAAIPAMLGFAPERSIVVACLGGPRASALGAVMRYDFVAPDASERVSAELSAVFAQFVQVCVRERVAAVTVAVVDDSALPSRVYKAAVTELDRLFAAHGIRVLGAHFAARLAAGEPWWSLLGASTRGRLPDPDTSGVALAHILEGRQIRSSRTEVAAQLARADEATADAVERLVATVPDEPTRIRVERTLAIIDRIAAGHRPSPADIAEGGVAVVDVAARDIMLGIAAGPLAGAAEELWLAATRSLPDSLRAATATLLGFSTYLRGDGPFAGMCFDVALTADPGHRLAVMLDAALTSGLRPSRIAGLVDAALEVAATFGVVLPPVTVPR